MCTVSYIPQHNGFVLTSNRDENPNRKTLTPQRIFLDNGEIINAPIDESNNGTWIATTNRNRVACLLNGAFVKHERQLPYRKSRGLIVLEAFSYDSFSHFVEEIDLDNIEPFTLILAEKDKLQTLIWDGEKKYKENLDRSNNHLWSSSTLYDREIHTEKLNFFHNFIANNALTTEAILNLHGLYEDNLFILNRPIVKTVSVTQVIVEDHAESVLDYNLKKEHIEV